MEWNLKWQVPGAGGGMFAPILEYIFFLLFLDIDLSEHYTCIPINYVYAKRTFVHRKLLQKKLQMLIVVRDGFNAFCDLSKHLDLLYYRREMEHAKYKFYNLAEKNLTP